MNNQKKIIILGASSGIGRELARLYAEKNYLVGIASRRKNLLREIKKEFPDNIYIEQINITHRSLATSRIHRLIKSLGGLDVFILSSGIGHRNPSLKFGLENDILKTNVSGFTSIINTVFKFFQKQEKGHIAAITSIAGIRGNRWAPAYGASKAFQINYMEALRIKSAKEQMNISVSEIRPGFVQTKMAHGSGVFWACTAKKAACLISKGISRKKKVIYVSKRWFLIAWFIKIMPKYFIDKI
jgi:short-subunit dehydrogenase